MVKNIKIQRFISFTIVLIFMIISTVMPAAAATLIDLGTSSSVSNLEKYGTLNVTASGSSHSSWTGIWNSSGGYTVATEQITVYNEFVVAVYDSAGTELYSESMTDGTVSIDLSDYPTRSYANITFTTCSYTIKDPYGHVCLNADQTFTGGSITEVTATYAPVKIATNLLAVFSS